ncbi:hypothetical protein ACS0TY_035625 [Phlomoides rotata]
MPTITTRRPLRRHPAPPPSTSPSDHPSAPSPGNAHAPPLHAVSSSTLHLSISADRDAHAPPILSHGGVGIRPCNIQFDIDQFDSSTEEGRRGIVSFFNWFHISFIVVLIITQTLTTYIQTSVSWALGLGIPTILMRCSIILFFIGARMYMHVKPEGSVFIGIVQVIAAAYKKQNINLPDFEGCIMIHPWKLL